MKILIADSNKWFLDSSDCFIEYNNNDKLHIDHSGHVLEQTLHDKKYDLLVLFLHKDPNFNFQQVQRITEAFKKLQILVVCTSMDKNHIFRLAKMGIKGLISFEECGKIDFIHAISNLASREPYYCKSINKLLMNQYINEERNKGNQTGNKKVTNREVQVLSLISEGYTNQDISEQLKISPLTVKNHRKNILDKFECKNTAEMIKVAFQHGILEM